MTNWTLQGSSLGSFVLIHASIPTNVISLIWERRREWDVKKRSREIRKKTMIVGVGKDKYLQSPTFNCTSEGKKTKSSREERSFRKRKKK